MALTLSVLSKVPVRIRNIRAGRSKPGLMEQHLKGKKDGILYVFKLFHKIILTEGLELVRDISKAKVTGAQIGSTEVTFQPGSINGGKYFSGVKTAGSISLLLQVALPCTLFADAHTNLRLQGGTNAEMAPQIDYTSEVFRPVLEKFGATFNFEMVRRGYFPKGGGEVVVDINPVRELNAVEMVDVGSVTALYGWSFVAGSLPMHMAHTMANSAVNVLKGIFGNVDIERYKESPEVATGNCSGIM